MLGCGGMVVQVPADASMGVFKVKQQSEIHHHIVPEGEL